MTVATDVLSADYVGNGATTAFPVPFPFLANAHIVLTTTTLGVDTVLTEGVDYTLTGAGGASGTATLATPLADGATLSIERTVPLTQETAFTGQGTFSPALHERALDKLTMEAQQLQKQLDELWAAIAALGGTGPSGGAGAIQFSDGSDFASNESKLFWDDTNQRLGIGTAGPSFPLHIRTSNAALSLAGLGNTASNGYSTFNFYDNSNVYKWSIGYANPAAISYASLAYVALGVNFALGDTDGANKWLTISTTGVTAIGTTALVVDKPNNRVGIGTASPGLPLELAVSNSAGSMLKLRNMAANGFSTLLFSDSSDASKMSFGFGNSGAASPYTSKAYLWLNTGVDFILTSGSGNPHVTVQNSTGNVGVGTASAATEKLEVGGNLKLSGTVELTTAGNGIFLKSPDGTRYRLTIANGGTVSVTAAP